jgi:hypothetical protein
MLLLYPCQTCVQVSNKARQIVLAAVCVSAALNSAAACVTSRILLLVPWPTPNSDAAIPGRLSQLLLLSCCRCTG